MNIDKAIYSATKILKMSNIKTAQLDSEILMSKVIKKDRKYIILNNTKKLEKRKKKYYDLLIRERSKGKPIAYLIGVKEFWKYIFYVNNNVLIPRPDSEILVQNVLNLTKYKSQLNILDIGVGSGCILLSILKEKKNFYGTGIDLSQKSLDICKINGEKLKLKNKFKLFKSDIDNFHYGKYDLIISNPPYINKLDLKYLDKDVLGFEPKIALDGGLDGLSEIRKVINKSAELLKRNGILVLEIGFNQKERVKRLLKKKQFYIKNVLKDFANNDRCIISKKI